MPSKISLDEEFVTTLSDHDELITSDEASDSSAAEQPMQTKKRKRDHVKSTRPSKKSRSRFDATEAQNFDAEQSSSSEGEQATKDGTIDSDFEFDIGANAVSDTVQDFDGWGLGSAPDSTKQVNHKKGADIDEIIARRLGRSNKPSNGPEIRNDDQAASEPVQENSESGSDDGSEIGFEEDENIAADTFGAGAELEDDDQVEVEDSAEEERSSVASPVPHPDDIASGNDSEDESATSHSDAEEAAKRKAFFAPEEQTKAVTTTATSSFQQFSLSRPLLRALAALTFSTPTPIQVRTIPIALQGLDVVGSAQTGSGKTAAFLLPIFERLLYRPRKIPTTRVAILMPTRELAVQCHQVAVALARFTDITFAQIVGGFSLREQETILKKRPDVVIATPGRFIDHMRNSASFAVENLEILVLDEADRMLDQGFTDELDEILRTIPKSRQTMLFSATMTDSVDKLVRVGMNRPVRVSVDAKRSTVSGLVQEFIRLRPGREEMRLASLCLLCTSIPDYMERTIIFFRQKKEAHRIRIVFGLLGIKAGELHGSMTQDQRIGAVNAFRDGKTTHLLATDVASRGLDIKNVLSVINYEAPQNHEIYLHRVGRTARAGRTGKACTIAAEPDRKVVKAAVRAARTQNAKVVSRVLDAGEVNKTHEQIDSLADEIEEVLKEEKEEKQLTQMEQDVQRGENLVKHHDEIVSRPKRTWFESEKEKKAAKSRAKQELNGTLFAGEKKKKLSNKDKKKLDLHRERMEGGRQWKKAKADTRDGVLRSNKNKKSKGNRK